MFIPFHDKNELRFIPFQFVTILLIAVNVAVFFWQGNLSDQADTALIMGAGMIPTSLFGSANLPPQLAMHIGSQITDLAPFEAAFSKAVELVKALRSDGHNIDRLDLGGGLGIPYEQDGDSPPDPGAYAQLIRQLTDGLGVQLIFEPGRMIVGNAGILVSEVIYLKAGEARNFLIVDAAMLKEALTKFPTPLNDCILIGDSLRDLQAAAKMQIRRILLRSGKGERTQSDGLPKDVLPVTVCENLAEAVDKLLAP